MGIVKGGRHQRTNVHVICVGYAFAFLGFWRRTKNCKNLNVGSYNINHNPHYTHCIFLLCCLTILLGESTFLSGQVIKGFDPPPTSARSAIIQIVLTSSLRTHETGKLCATCSARKTLVCSERHALRLIGRDSDPF